MPPFNSEDKDALISASVGKLDLRIKGSLSFRVTSRSSESIEHFLPKTIAEATEKTFGEAMQGRTGEEFEEVRQEVIASLKAEQLATALLKEEVTALLTPLSEAVPATIPSSFWVELLGPADKTGDYLLNLGELFSERWVPRYGLRRAKLIWYSQSLQFVVRYWIGYVVEAMKLWPTSS